MVDGLAWVKQNISAFGGDPDNVMIFGESGGGAKTSCSYAMPSAAPYFNKASIERGRGCGVHWAERAAATTEQVLKVLSRRAVRLAQAPGCPRRHAASGAVAISAGAAASEAGQKRRHQHRTGRLRIRACGRRRCAAPSSLDPTARPLQGQTAAHRLERGSILPSFAWERRDSSAVGLDFAGLAHKLEPQFGEDTSQIVATYRQAIPDASPTDIFVAISSITMMGLGSVEIAGEEGGAARRRSISTSSATNPK
ncbi:MAG: carboxylesterase family protein [Caldilineaceae bacterium]